MTTYREYRERKERERELSTGTSSREQSETLDEEDTSW